MKKTLNQKIYETPEEIRATLYSRGYEDGKRTMLSEIKGILEDCAWDNGMMIVRALQDLIEKYGVQNAR